MDQTLKIVARMVAAPGQADGLADHMKQLVEDTRKEPGCLRYDLLRGTDNPDILIFVEEWENRDLWQAHMAGEAIRAFNARIGNGAFAAGEVHPLQQIS
ncbi:putative quinol monooxygenase [Mameliella sediminis]|uniref:putative quinol monooxygenase n=1 Tax=Mameliella sediminis TaxID=2836866 RepID=UPI001C447D9F|nr:putative quinol monooxygenase [Mameliella sediminis]MBY6114611.1 antibiotic biosynthesis monooxygenase [Antarctobacter heliothermus]MBY6144184.1 antibiotic biosynthesis monooxygenase [Mameliella alba]MBV7392908.1 antibiotic biosynthesis monooxygenase [Mameliella sediminis]MBY6161524.1 antibiotic biosynthesis monooxygenase [Mameliella alba]MBY6170010.1 antibiotic biosynthesis monooxygenase [Mameliella alba]